ncbi:MAG: cytochrome c [Terriglobales bacterium]
MRRLAVFLCVCVPMFAHDIITTKVTWDREISRLIFDRCTSCHRDGGSAFSLTTYDEARPWAKAIKEEALERRMPPFGAVKGFSDLRNDRALTQEQLEIISDWVEGGAPEGDAALLPKDVNLNPPKPTEVALGAELVVDGNKTLQQPMTVAAIRPKTLAQGASIRVVAQRPDGAIIPLLWIYQYNPKFEQTYYFRLPLKFPAGTKILTSTTAGSVALLAPAPGQKLKAGF